MLVSSLFLTSKWPMLKIKLKGHIACLFTAICGRRCTIQLSHFTWKPVLVLDCRFSVNLGALQKGK